MHTERWWTKSSRFKKRTFSNLGPSHCASENRNCPKQTTSPRPKDLIDFTLAYLWPHVYDWCIFVTRLSVHFLQKANQTNEVMVHTFAFPFAYSCCSWGAVTLNTPTSIRFWKGEIWIFEKRTGDVSLLEAGVQISMQFYTILGFDFLNYVPAHPYILGPGKDTKQECQKEFARYSRCILSGCLKLLHLFVSRHIKSNFGSKTIKTTKINQNFLVPKRSTACDKNAPGIRRTRNIVWTVLSDGDLWAIAKSTWKSSRRSG